jgi:hypothetical protein
MKKPVALAVWFATLTACDPVWSVNLRITVEPAAQAAVGIYPQALLLRDATDTYLASVLCAPSVEPSIVETHWGGLGDSPDTATVWLQAMPAGLSEPCGTLAYSKPVWTFEPLASAWSATFHLGHQNGYLGRVDLVLEPPGSAP